MTLPRISSLVLAIGGSFWALMLIGLTFRILPHTANSPGGLVWLLIWLPGFTAWYGYIRHVFGHYLLRQARITWFVSLVANTWALFLLHERLSIALAWIIMAAILSLVCLVKEWRLREPEIKPAMHVTDEQFRNLLDEHRKRQR